MSHHSRAMGGAVRQAIIGSYANGDAVGFEVAQRAMWEIGDAMADIHGRRKAAEAIYRIADEIVAGDFITPLEITPESAGAASQALKAGWRGTMERNAFMAIWVAFLAGAYLQSVIN